MCFLHPTFCALDGSVYSLGLCDQRDRKRELKLLNGSTRLASLRIPQERRESATPTADGWLRYDQNLFI